MTARIRAIKICPARDSLFFFSIVPPLLEPKIYNWLYFTIAFVLLKIISFGRNFKKFFHLNDDLRHSVFNSSALSSHGFKRGSISIISR